VGSRHPPGQGDTPGPTTSSAGNAAAGAGDLAFLRGDFVVDHTRYGTTSIAATIERRFDLAPLSSRDAAVRDLSSVFHAKQSMPR
jgi:hypothetical protein